MVHGNPNAFEVMHNGKWVQISQRLMAKFSKIMLDTMEEILGLFLVRQGQMQKA